MYRRAESEDGMTTKIADDYAAIAAAMKAQAENADFVGLGATGPVCLHCEDGGWVLSSYQAVGAPNVETCPKCGNPEDHPAP
jgi:hypothetical protein